jgi:hypothetical protein
MIAPEALEHVLARAGEDRFAPNRAPLPPHVWAAAVGARIAERTRPIAIENGVLVVRAATSVWASELSLLSEPLIARLRAAGIGVRALRFRVGTIDPPDQAVEARTAKVPAPIALDGKVARSIARVKDDELRDLITQAASTNLAWQAFNAEGKDGAGAPKRTSGAPRAARAPRDAETESVPQDQTTPTSRGAGRGNRGDD